MGSQQMATFRQHQQLLPLLLIAAYCINAIITAVRGTVIMAGDTYNFELTTKHYFAFGAIGLNFLTYFLFRPFYKYTLGLTIASGLFNLMTFPALETTQSFAFKKLESELPAVGVSCRTACVPCQLQEKERQPDQIPFKLNIEVASPEHAF